MTQGLIKINEDQSAQTVKDTVSESIINDNREILNEMARINRSETDKGVFPYKRWEVIIWSVDQNPPHFHIRCDGWDVSFLIQNGNLLEVLKSGNAKEVVEYMSANVSEWLRSKCFIQPKLTNRENAQLIWDQLHDGE